MKKRLRNAAAVAPKVDESAQICHGFEIIGDIAIIKAANFSQVIAKQMGAATIMERHKNVKAVFAQETGVHGAFRLRGLTHMAGENRTYTIHRESGCSFKVDLEKCFFSPRLSGERLRIAQQVQTGETIINMFAGVGCFSILIAKRVQNVKVYSIDINPSAVQYMNENIRLNTVYGRVIPLLNDSREIVENRLLASVDRVLLLLPEKSLEYLNVAVSALKPSGGWVHYYDFEHAQKDENPLEKSKLKVMEKLDKLEIDYSFESSRIVRKVGPHWYQLVLDIHITKAPHKS